MDPLLLLQISRPGLWLVFIWLYLWPSGGKIGLIEHSSFWLGVVYCTFPLNLLVYGMNDMVDCDTDKKNSRKGNYIFGAKAAPSKLRKLPTIMYGLNCAFIILFTILNWDLFYIWWLLAAFLVNAVYNWKPFALSRHAPWEVPCMIAGHFLIPLLSCQLNKLQYPGIGSWVFHALLLSRSHLWLEMMDINEDSSCGKRTIAVVLGGRLTLLLILLLTAAESWTAFYLLHSGLLGFFSVFGAILLVTMHVAESNGLSFDKKMVSITQSFIGVFLMLHVWQRGELVS